MASKDHGRKKERGKKLNRYTNVLSKYKKYLQSTHAHLQSANSKCKKVPSKYKNVPSKTKSIFFPQSKNILLANWNKVLSNSARAYLQTWQITPISSQSLDDRPGIRRAPSTVETKQDPA